MLRTNLPTKSVPRAEYDRRARDVRLHLEHVERLLVKRAVRKTFRPFRLVRLLGFSVRLSTRVGDQTTGSPSDRRPCGALAQSGERRPAHAPSARHLIDPTPFPRAAA